MTTRKKVLSSTLFFMSGALFALGIAQKSVCNLIISVCEAVVAINCMNEK